MAWRNGRSKKEQIRLDKRVIQDSGIKSFSAKKIHSIANRQQSKVKRTAVTSDYSVLSSDYIIGVDSSSGSLTVTLPSASSVNTGRLLIIKDEGGLSGSSKRITIAASGSQTIDGASTVALKTNYSCIQIYSTGSGWAVIDSDHLDLNHLIYSQVFG